MYIFFVGYQLDELIRLEGFINYILVNNSNRREKKTLIG